jgi:hypothetical protein
MRPLPVPAVPLLPCADNVVRGVKHYCRSAANCRCAPGRDRRSRGGLCERARHFAWVSTRTNHVRGPLPYLRHLCAGAVRGRRLSLGRPIPGRNEGYNEG